ncbi:MAG TPA: M28 family peptidase, partial [Thermoanaerobaculia bacterium]|nr:M28 family peptidase [Thermoanaerobaculia bacterium]
MRSALLISLSLLAPAALPAYPARTLSPKQAAADAALTRQALEVIHPGLHRYTPKAEMDAAFARLEERVKQPVSDVELYGEISLLLAKIHCDHTKAELPGALSRYRKENPTHLPFRFRLFDGRMYVASSQSPQLARGTEILSINGVPVSDILARIAPAVSYDGSTDFVIPTKLEADSDLMGSDFDQFFPVFFGFSDTLKVEVPGRTLDLKPVTFAQWQSLPWPSVPNGAEFHKTTTWKWIDAKTAYLRIDTFVNYRNPVDPATVYDPIFQALQGAGHLVVDLRENGGGSTDASEGLARYLLDKPFAITKSVRLKAIRYGELPKHIETWGDPKEWFEAPEENFDRLPDGWFEEKAGTAPVSPSPHQFKGRVTMLTGPANGSGSTMLIAKLKDEGRVRLVGMPTGGSAEGPTGGRIFFLKLPESGITVRIPAKRSLTNISNFQPGLGVAPDVEVRPTLADFLAGRDPALGVATGLTADAVRLDKPTNAERLEALKTLLRERGLEFEVQPFTNEGQNVIVTLGSGPSDIVVGAHYDAARLQDGTLSHGMTDNAAGSVVLTRVAEALKARKLRHRVRVVFFDQEEMGLLGSAHYVKALDGKVAAAVNVDIAGYGDTLIFGPGKNEGNSAVYGAMWRTCAEQRLSCLELPNFPPGDDRSFQAAKIPNISLAILPALEAHQIWLLLNGGK